MPFPFMAAAVLGSGALSALSGSSAAKKAAAASTYATDQDIALRRQMYDTQRADMQPYMQAGYAAQDTLANRLGLGSGAAAVGRAVDGGVGDGGAFFAYDPSNSGASISAAPAGSAGQVNRLAGNASPGTYGTTEIPSSYKDPGSFSYTASDFQASPGYQFALDQGIRAIDASAAHRGSLDSGATLKGITKFAMGLANQEFNAQRDYAAGRFDVDANRARSIYADDRNYLTQRWDTQTGNLLNVAGLGQASAAGVGAAGTNYAAGAGSALQNNAANIGNAGLVAANNFNSTLGQGINYLAQQQRPGGAVNGLVYTGYTGSPYMGASGDPYADLGLTAAQYAGGLY